MLLLLHRAQSAAADAATSWSNSESNSTTVVAQNAGFVAWTVFVLTPQIIFRAKIGCKLQTDIQLRLGRVMLTHITTCVIF